MTQNLEEEHVGVRVFLVFFAIALESIKGLFAYKETLNIK